MKISATVLLIIASLLVDVHGTHAQEASDTTAESTAEANSSPPESTEIATTPEALPADPAADASKKKRVENKFKKTKPKSQAGNYNEKSSSYVPYADPLDPLPVNSENLKDEDDIVVDDIKEVLESPLPPPVLEPAPPPQEASAPPPVESSTPPLSDSDVHPSKIDEFAEDNSLLSSSDAEETKEIIKKPRKKRKARREKVYDNNEPDLDLEKRFHQLYMRLNSQPTNAQAWEAVTAPRSAQVYIIQKGDNLYNISGTLFGDSQFWPKVWSLNEMDILNPHFIYPNQRIYFYPGTIDMAPTLGLEKTPNTILPNEGYALPEAPPPQAPDVAAPLAEEKPKLEEKMDATSAELIQESAEDAEDAIERSRRPILSEEKAIDGRTYDRQNTEWRKNIIVKSKKESVDEVEKIPNSIPEYFSGKYFEPRKADFTFDIKRPVIKPVEVPPNPYLVTSNVVLPDFKIPSSHADSIQCKENHFVQKIEKVNLQAQPGRYFILEHLKLTGGTFKTTQFYRWIATAEVAANDSLRILRCRQLINTDALVVSQEKINQLAEPIEQGPKNLEIVEGLDFVNQVFVAANQFVLLSAGTDLLQEDQTYSIFSKQAGASVGKITVVKKRGSLAIGYVIEASDVIRMNDSLVVE